MDKKQMNQINRVVAPIVFVLTAYLSYLYWGIYSMQQQIALWLVGVALALVIWTEGFKRKALPTYVSLIGFGFAIMTFLSRRCIGGFCVYPSRGYGLAVALLTGLVVLLLKVGPGRLRSIFVRRAGNLKGNSLSEESSVQDNPILNRDEKEFTTMTSTHSSSSARHGSRHTGRFGWIVDTQFNNFVTPFIVSALYAIGLVLTALVAIGYWIVTIADFSEDGAGTALVTALWTAPLILVAALLIVILLRLAFESIIVRFRIAEDLRHIRDR